ncbi:hypothetical protein [Paraburkholderia sediminicola]|uniref:hypothetical protein n=1 Tax=Paraburkholderia sediminicola TaxID=458836 RepID=UPI0038BDB9BA
MPRQKRAADEPASENAGALHALRIAAVAMVLTDPVAAQALLDLPDAELGRRFKVALLKVAGLAAVLNVDLDSIQRHRQKTLPQPKRGSTRANPRSTPAHLLPKAMLLHKLAFCDGMSITEKRLNKDVAAGRLFSVDIDGDEYFPTFFLVGQLDRKALAKTIRRLGDLSGWRKWDFFTTPEGSLGGLTPLQALIYRQSKEVLKTAGAFVER